MWEDLDGITLREINQRMKNTIWAPLYAENETKQNTLIESGLVVTRGKEGANEVLMTGQKVPASN